MTVQNRTDVPKIGQKTAKFFENEKNSQKLLKTGQKLTKIPIFRPK
jgi:hypothetical protein